MLQSIGSQRVELDLATEQQQPRFEKLANIVDNIEIMSREGVCGNECFQKRGCGKDLIVVFQRIDCCVRAELCRATPQGRARANGIHGGRFWLNIGKTWCQ